MTHLFRGTLIIACALIPLLSQLSDAAPGTSVLNFVSIDPSARTAALAETNSAIAAGSLQTNPAVLPYFRSAELSLEHAAYLSGSGFSLLSLTVPLNSQSGMNITGGYFSLGDIPKTVYDPGSPDNFTESGSIAYTGYLAGIGYGRRISSSFSYGIGFKMARDNLDGSENIGSMVSLGGLYYNPRKGYRFGFGGYNFGAPVKGYSLPSALFMSVGRYERQKLFWTVELMDFVSDGQRLELRSGIEYRASPSVALRGGYRLPFSNNDLSGSLTNFSGGLGFTLTPFIIDYAWTPYGDLGDIHRISLTSRFDTAKESRRE